MALRTIDTGTTDLLAHIDDGVAVITMNRPERRNALSPAMIAALADTLAACETNTDVGTVVLTGAGAAFCAGGDVKGMAEAQDGPEAEAIDARNRYMKENLNGAAAEGCLGDCLDLEASHHIHCALTQDHRQAAKASVEQRTPQFVGR